MIDKSIMGAGGGSFYGSSLRRRGSKWEEVLNRRFVAVSSYHHIVSGYK